MRVFPRLAFSSSSLSLGGRWSVVGGGRRGGGGGGGGGGGSFS